MPARSPVVLALIVAALGSAGCAINPVSGRPEFSVVSESLERDIGREASRGIEAEMGLVDDPRLVEYVRQVGQRLATHSPLAGEYNFQVVDMAEPNAFSLPGGWVYVSRGLLALLCSEDELAGVVGHEIGHVAARHAVQRVSRAAPIAIVTGLGAAVTGLVSPMLGEAIAGVGSATNAMLLAPYGRDQEREADRVGADLEAKAGWDPAGLVSALRTLEREEALCDRPTAEAPSFFATHPPLPERAEHIVAYARGLPRASAAPIAGTPQAFLQRLDGLVIGDSAAQGVFDGTTFVHPDLGFAVTFPGGWTTTNARDAVGATAPNQDAIVVVDLAGNGDDPMRMLADIDARARTDLAQRAERFDVNGRRAARVAQLARTDEGTVALDLTFLADRGRIFRIIGGTYPADAERMAPTFKTVARSFRSPTATERAGVRETRLRLVRARAGETIVGLTARIKSAWSADMVAVANGLDTSTRLTEGQPIKVALSEPYRPRR